MQGYRLQTSDACRKPVLAGSWFSCGLINVGAQMPSVAAFRYHSQPAGGRFLLPFFFLPSASMTRWRSPAVDISQGRTQTPRDGGDDVCSRLRLIDPTSATSCSIRFENIPPPYTRSLVAGALLLSRLRLALGLITTFGCLTVWLFTAFDLEGWSYVLEATGCATLTSMLKT